TPPRITLDRPASCAGSANRARVTQPTEPGTYWNNVYWTIANGTITGPNNFDSVDFTTDPSGQPATLTATLTDNLGCVTSVSTTVAIRTITPPPITLDRPASCAGAANRATVTQPTEPGTYWNSVYWTIANGTINGTNSFNSVDFTTNPGGQPTTVTALLIDNLGCSTTASATAGIAAVPPVPVITASGPTTFCVSDSVTLTAPSSSTDSYLWSNGATTRSITVTTAGS